MNRITTTVTAELRDIPGVRDVGAHAGRALASDQIVNINSGEVWLCIDPAVDYGSLSPRSCPWSTATPVCTAI